VNRIIKILLYLAGFLLTLFAIGYAIVLFMVNLLPENAHKVVLVAIAAIALLVIAKKMSFD